MASTQNLFCRTFARSLSSLRCNPRANVSHIQQNLHAIHLNGLIQQTRQLSGLSIFTNTFRASTPAPIVSTPRVALSSILQFARTGIRNATHRDYHGSGSSYGRSPNRGPRFPWIESIPNSVIFYGIIGLNVGVFLTWQAATATWQQTGDTSLIRFLRDNFVVEMRNISSGRIWTLVTSCFSHRDFSHALFNGLTFFFMAPAVMQMLGKTRFLGLYFIGGILSGLTSLSWNDLVKHHPIASHGASGAIYAIAAYFACALPRATFLIFFVIPCPAWVFLPGILIYDGYRSISNKNTTTDTAGHVGGLLAGIAYFAARRFGIFL
ncbi:hypothetical protein SERLADRAFT_382112 [Serpula lacrymans var. lacrymans S7.9]|uniref:Peptidase S54 rhomboid domain-containing protein n=1 Tax=Serpula lacrymans var. lacrymans (strain S7.9) TaxID=578457 RepID=F8NMI7_SERL9|nr:uncharacterized protein SERLADRAFT_382112 [Serpula lacrymans var. lacrymans S7.9]EGO27384.1 hypothetical protein SERLADRAFT_382112 [Serpula lacrymans var. lacrymans S7.9]